MVEPTDAEPAGTEELRVGGRTVKLNVDFQLRPVGAPKSRIVQGVTVVLSSVILN